MSVKQQLERFYRTVAEQHQLGSIISLLRWDQNVMMPPGGGSERARQIQMMTEQRHALRTAPEFVDLTFELAGKAQQLSETDQVNVREIARVVKRLTKLPKEFVARKSYLQSITTSLWTAARPANDFSAVSANLREMIQLCRDESRLIDPSAHPYDVHLDIYEPGMKLAVIKPIFTRLAERLRPVIPRIVERQRRIDPGLFEPLPLDARRQEDLNIDLAKLLGYPFERGRLDKTAHPFASTITPNDVRITTRYDEADCLSSLYSTLHELGHAFYDLGLPAEHAGTPRGMAVSLGIHESQSRLLENCIGRSEPFCRLLAELLGPVFGRPVAELSNRVHAIANRVGPSLIRVAADEVTYPLHIHIRLSLEEALLSGALEVDSLPEAWNEQYRQNLGITSPTLTDGVLQDIHWYQGSIGYFPTYTLGTLYAAALFEKIQAELAPIDELCRLRDFAALKQWLSAKVYSHGMRFSAQELMTRIIGAAPAEDAFLRYVSGKYLNDVNAN